MMNNNNYWAKKPFTHHDYIKFHETVFCVFIHIQKNWEEFHYVKPPFKDFNKEGSEDGTSGLGFRFKKGPQINPSEVKSLLNDYSAHVAIQIQFSTFYGRFKLYAVTIN